MAVVLRSGSPRLTDDGVSHGARKREVKSLLLMTSAGCGPSRFRCIGHTERPWLLDAPVRWRL